MLTWIRQLHLRRSWLKIDAGIKLCGKSLGGPRGRGQSQIHRSMYSIRALIYGLGTEVDIS